VAEREQHKLAKRLRRQVGEAIADFGMIEAGDKVMVCLSGGKDSYTLLDVLLQLQKKAPVPFELVAVNLDQKQPDFPEHVLPEYLAGLGVPYHIIEQDTYSVVSRVIPEGKTMCSLCSRLRRGALYNYAETHGFTKIALGHHRDDMVATFFMNLFHHAKLSGMPPKLRSDDGRHVVIRPLAYVRESDIVEYAQARQFPIIPCNLCGSQENLQRRQVGLMLKQWEKDHPGRIEQIARAMGEVRPSQLADTTLFDFMALGRRDDAPLPDAHAWLAGPGRRRRRSRDAHRLRSVALPLCHPEFHVLSQPDVLPFPDHHRFFRSRHPAAARPAEAGRRAGNEFARLHLAVRPRGEGTALPPHRRTPVADRGRRGQDPAGGGGQRPARAQAGGDRGEGRPPPGWPRAQAHEGRPAA
jgi:tRNA 2-thiocytidine biosynthesis protein TtcA